MGSNEIMEDDEDHPHLALHPSQDNDEWCGMEMRFDGLSQDNTAFVDVKFDGMSIKYTGKATTDHDVGSVRTKRPVLRDQWLYYFEVTITNGPTAASGDGGTFSVGLADAGFRLNKHPGWDARSYGYHSDGQKYHEGGHGVEYGPAFGMGDTVGCGLIFSTKEIFFTLNGTRLGTAFSVIDMAIHLYPVVGLHALGATAVANFGDGDVAGGRRRARYGGEDVEAVEEGAVEPFKFDPTPLITRARTSRAEEEAQMRVSMPWMAAAVRAYAVRMGYKATYESLMHGQPTVEAVGDADSGGGRVGADARKGQDEGGQGGGVGTSAVGLPTLALPTADPTALDTLDMRAELRALVLEGRAMDALGRLVEVYPDAFVVASLDAADGQQGRDRADVAKDEAGEARERVRGHVVRHRLLVQALVELIAKGESLAAVDFARTHIAQHRSDLSDSEEARFLDAMSLLAFNDPHETATGAAAHLLSIKARHEAAAVANDFVLCEALERGEGTSRQVDGNGGEGGAQKIWSHLERAVAELFVAHRALRTIDGGGGEVLRKEDVLRV